MVLKRTALNSTALKSTGNYSAHSKNAWRERLLGYFWGIQAPEALV
jgi:hypothetical protein